MNQPETECCIVASVLCDPMGKPGPNTCTVLAHWEWFESPVASFMAKAVVECSNKGWRTTPRNVERLLAKDNKAWVRHKSFNEYGALPLSIAECEAVALLPIYRRKRIAQAIGEAFAACTMKPENTRQVAIDLKYKLEELDFSIK